MQINTRIDLVIAINKELHKYQNKEITKNELLAYLELCGYVDRYNIDNNYLTIYFTKPYTNSTGIADIGEPL